MKKYSIESLVVKSFVVTLEHPDLYIGGDFISGTISDGEGQPGGILCSYLVVC